MQSDGTKIIVHVLQKSSVSKICSKTAPKTTEVDIFLDKVKSCIGRIANLLLHI